MIMVCRVAAVLLCLSIFTFSPAVVAAQEESALAGSNSRCGESALEISRCMIDAILEDVMATYTQVGGGGITDIRQVATHTYTVSIAQEERIDLITYQLDINSDGQVVITERSEDTRTPGR